MTQRHFDQMTPERPDYDAVAAAYAEVFEHLEREPTEAVKRWDELRRELSNYRALTGLQFAQNTRDADARAEKEFADEFFPRVADLQTRMKRQLLERRDVLEPTLGAHIFELWTSDVATFEPAIESELVAEAKTTTERNELVASAEIEFDGESLNLAQLARHCQSSDRAHREAATRANWGWYAEHSEQTDDIYDRLVELRTRMARKLGFETYTPLGYLRMQRVDYSAQDVARFRSEVVEHIVPLVAELKRKQADALGVETLKVWDDAVHDPAGTPKPNGSPEEMIERAGEMFGAMHPELGAFFDMMLERGLTDLVSRKGKAAGGFCTSLEGGAPFIFGNFNGTHSDMHTFTHEMGHAFQCWLSRENYPLDLMWPTLESCEIHSMSLEFFCAPHMELFFGDDADRYRRLHLTENLTFIPYGVAVDHFQHLVYDNPDATPADRRAMWLEMEATYLPWRDWDDIEHGASGGGWHKQGHIFGSPFYYIDYVLALTCALQFWSRMRDDPAGALADYVTLCRRGGDASFLELVRSAKLRSPFEPGSLISAVETARQTLDL